MPADRPAQTPGSWSKRISETWKGADRPAPAIQVLREARDKLANLTRNEWLDKLILTGDEARALDAAFEQLQEAAAALLADDDMPNHWDDCMCSYCVRNRALRAALRAVQGDA